MTLPFGGPRCPTPSPAPEAELSHFLGRYLRPADRSPAHAPDLGYSLRHLASAPGLSSHLARIPSPCACLIEGYAAPRNAAALRVFLGHSEARRVQVTAIDLYDLPATYDHLGLPLPPLRFVRADAARLQSTFPDASFDVVVQDFLLNCAPPALAPRILAEATRVLRPGGLFVLSFTDDTCLAGHPRSPLHEITDLRGLAVSDDARGLHEWTSDPDTRARLALDLGGRVLALPGESGAAFVTRPHGRFEFFVPRARTLAQLDQAGLVTLTHVTSLGRDDHDLACVRHHCLLQRPPSTP